MSYYEIGLLAEDRDFLNRCMACAAVEIETQDLPREPGAEVWTMGNRWRLAAMPGFGNAYSSALVSGVERPGKEQSVITDAMILAAVQPIIGGSSG